MTSFIAELGRRNVLRVATAYALVAWIIIEAGSVLLPTFGASERFFQLYVIAVIGGFVVSVVFAWVFELTPEGVRLDKNVDRAAAVDPAAGQKMNYVIIALLLIALAVSITFNVTGIREDVTEFASPGRSIAVLPFTSRSDDPENRLFADGIHDDLLTKLANIKALKVTSRTSVMGYRDEKRNLREIAAELGVETILEGAVQRVGDNVRINLQLIDARTDEHLWAQTYDRPLTIQNIFSIQSEISEAVAAALKATLSPDEQVRMAVVPTRDLRAYRLFTEAKTNLYARRLETIRKAREQFQEAITLDPQYAEAHAGLAESTLLLMINHKGLPEPEAIAAAQASLDRALELDPKLADAYAILGLLKLTVWGQTRLGPENLDAEAAFRRAISLNPNHASAHMWFASLRDSEERLDEAIDLYQKAIELDPLARIPYSNLPTIYAKKGQAEEAMQLWLKAVRIHSDWPTIYEYIAIQLWGLGRLDEAYAWHQKAIEVGNDPTVGGNMDLGILIELGEFDKARAALDGLAETHPFHSLADGFRMLLDARYADAQRLFVEALELGEVPPRFVLPLAADTALLAGDLVAARKYTLAATPILATDARVTIDRNSARDAVKLAYIEQREGHAEKALELLNAALIAIRDLPRVGSYGFGIRDVQIYALLGRTEDALAAFRDAIDQGYRGSIMFDGWLLEMDPFLESIHQDPRFVLMNDELDQYLEAMRQSLIAAEETGDWDGLRAKVERI
ncbi:MAG: tetratricopeptide repeat protein [Woeseiaceae bacterium]|nr:tetratricopeptide repeat protein [Woeseiaceae bacterium]